MLQSGFHVIWWGTENLASSVVSKTIFLPRRWEQAECQACCLRRQRLPCLPPCQQHCFHSMFIGILSRSPHDQKFLLWHSSQLNTFPSIITNWMFPSKMSILLCNIKFYSLLTNFTLKLNCLFCPEFSKLNNSTFVPFLAFFSCENHSDLRRNQTFPLILETCASGAMHAYWRF